MVIAAESGPCAQDIPLFLTSLIPVESIDEDSSARRSHRHTGDLVDMASSFMVRGIFGRWLLLFILPRSVAGLFRPDEVVDSAFSQAQFGSAGS